MDCEHSGVLNAGEVYEGFKNLSLKLCPAEGEGVSFIPNTGCANEFI